MKIVSLKYDFCAKEVMENEIVRKHFISDVLGIPLNNIRSVRIMNPSIRKRFKYQKQGILDILMELNDDSKVNVEIQLRQQADWEKRSVFYLAKMYAEDLRSGEQYEKTKKCIAIYILDFNMDKGGGYHNTYMLRDKCGNLYTDLLELHTIELQKKPDTEQPDPLDEWHGLFNAKTEDDLDMIKSKTKNAGIIEAIKELKEISLPTRLRFEREMRLKEKRDRYAEDKFIRRQAKEEGIKEGIEQGMKEGIEQGMKEGMERGMKQGIEQGIDALIRSMRDINATDEQITNALTAQYGLSREEALKKLQQ